MERFPPNVLGPFRSIACHPVTDGVEASQLLDVEVKKFSSPLSLVSLGWRRRLETAQSIQAMAPADSAHARQTHSRSLGDGSQGHPLTPQGHDSILEFLRCSPNPMGTRST